MNPIRDDVAAALDAADVPSGATVVVGVSGGCDSIVLAHVLDALGRVVHAAHVNYNLRPGAADDEALVRAFCEKRSLPLHVHQVDGAAEAERQGTSVQAAAREVRYAFFGEAAAAVNASVVAVAHHRDDQAETVLLNLLRGCGPEGLAGMPAERPLHADEDVRLMRPLLHTRRRAIRAYARHHHLSWREDPSNQSLSYERGALRAAVLPAIEEHLTRDAVPAMARTADLMRAYVDSTVTPALTQYWEQVAVADDEQGGGRLRLDPLAALPPVWQTRLILVALRRWLPGVPRSAATADEVCSLCEAQVGRSIPWPGGTVWREREALRFDPTPGTPTATGTLATLPDAVDLPQGRLEVTRLNGRPDTLHTIDPYTVIVDADRLAWPLTVRPWQPGDTLQPLGMKGHKKVSDLLTDTKVPPHIRARVLVVADVARIVWVVGLRLADPVRVQDDTHAFAKITYNSDTPTPSSAP